MKSLSLSAPALPSRAAVAAAVTALALTGCANYFGMKSDKQISSPAQYESTQSLPGQGGQWPSLDWANQFGDPQLPQADRGSAGRQPVDRAGAGAHRQGFVVYRKLALGAVPEGQRQLLVEPRAVLGQRTLPASVRRHLV